MARTFARLSTLLFVGFLFGRCSGATTPMTMAITYPSQADIAKMQDLQQASGLDTLCLNFNFAVYATSSNVIGAPTYNEVCWRGGYFIVAPTFARVGLPISFESVSSAYSQISSSCGTLGPLPAYVFATTTTTQSVFLDINGSFGDILAPSDSAFSKFLCQFTFTPVPSTCLPAALSSLPGLAYAVAAWGSPVVGFQWSTLCNSMFTTDTYITGTFVDIESHPISYSNLRSLFEGCPVPSFLLNQQLPGYADYLNMILFNPPTPYPTPFFKADPATWAICSYAARTCYAELAGWFLGSIYPGVPATSWATLCSGYLSTGSIGVFRTPLPEDLLIWSEIYSQCPFGTENIYTAGQPASLPSYVYAWCSYSPLQFLYSTLPPTVTTTTTSETTTSTRILISKTLTESFTFFTFSTTFLVTSTSITTTATSTIVKTSPSTTTTTTTTTSTSVRVISDSTTSTLTTSLTFTNSITTRSTGSFTETVKTSLQTTITRFITRTYCEPSQTTTTLTTSQVRTLTETDVDTVYVDITVYTTISKTKPTSDDCPQSTKTRTKCATSTQIECKTSVVFQRPDTNDNQCPSIEAVVCNQGPSGILLLFNNFPYDSAVCPCQAVGKSMLVLREDTDFMDAYAAVVKCGGSMGRAWAVVAQDYTRCYIVSGDGSVRPAPSCDEPLPVLCR